MNSSWTLDRPHCKVDMLESAQIIKGKIESGNFRFGGMENKDLISPRIVLCCLFLAVGTRLSFLSKGERKSL